MGQSEAVNARPSSGGVNESHGVGRCFCCISSSRKKVSTEKNSFSSICKTRPGLVINILFSLYFNSPAVLKNWPL